MKLIAGAILILAMSVCLAGGIVATSIHDSNRALDNMFWSLVLAAGLAVSGLVLMCRDLFGNEPDGDGEDDPADKVEDEGEDAE